jgi:hypothetical protein
MITPNRPAQKAVASMADLEVSYCTREQVQREMGFADSWRLNKRVDDKIKQGARDIEGWCHRFFHPLTATRKFDVPRTDTLWLYQHELTSVQSIVSGDTAMSETDYILRPESGPPYGWIDVNWSGSIGWQAGNTWQRAIEITGDYHYPTVLDRQGEIVSAATDSATTITLSDSSEIGVGSLVLAGQERMVVTEKTLTTSGAALEGVLTANKAEVVITLDLADLVIPGELIAIGGERMLVESASGVTLTVRRGEAGSTLAAHTDATAVYVPRVAEVARGQLGTLSAAHDAHTPIYLLRPPSLVTEANVALACAALEHGSSGFARSVGSGESQRQADDRGLGRLMEDLYTRYARKARGRAVGA